MGNLSFGIIALGANLPGGLLPVVETIRAAARSVHSNNGIEINGLSRIWRTPAHPPGSGPDYANACAIIRTRHDPVTLLAILHSIEAAFGRDRSTGTDGPVRWGARVLDLDLIAMGDLVAPNAATLRRWINLPADRQQVDTPGHLILPHPRMQDRGFVLAPLAEIAPHWRHPLDGRSVVQMLADLGPDALSGMAPVGGARP